MEKSFTKQGITKPKVGGIKSAEYYGEVLGSGLISNQVMGIRTLAELRELDEAGAIVREVNETTGKPYWAIGSESEMVTDTNKVRVVAGREAMQGEYYRHVRRYTELSEKQEKRRYAQGKTKERAETLSFSEIKSMFS